MFTLPSIWNLIASTIVFLIAMHYLRKWLSQNGLPAGMTRGLLVFLIASIIAWPAGEAADWLHHQLTGELVKQSPPSAELSHLLEQLQPLQQPKK